MARRRRPYGLTHVRAPTRTEDEWRTGRRADASARGGTGTGGKAGQVLAIWTDKACYRQNWLREFSEIAQDFKTLLGILP